MDGINVHLYVYFMQDDYVTLPFAFFENLWQPELQIQNSKIAGNKRQNGNLEISKMTTFRV